MKKEYPIYLKYPNNKIFIKIKGESVWDEIRYIGTQQSLETFTAEIFSDRVYLNDLLSYLEQGLLIGIGAQEYQKQLDKL